MFEHHTIHITPLSPIHIGCNEHYEPSNYIIENDALYAFNPEQLLQALEPVKFQKLIHILNQAQQEKLLLGVQNFFYDHRQDILPFSEHYIPVATGVDRLYRSRIGRVAQQEKGGKKIINQLEIEKTAYEPFSLKPLIPGSSIKGAIRTALLDALNQGRPLPDEIKKAKPSQQNGQLQAKLMHGQFHTDPLRLVHISDAIWQAPAAIGTEVLFAVNRHRRQTEKASMAEEKGLYQLLECLMPQQYRALGAELNCHHLKNSLPAQYHKQLPHFDWSAAYIAQTCNHFYRPLLEKEIKIISDLSYAHRNWLQTMRALLPQLNEKRFLIRLGYHSGAEAVTLNGLRSIKIMRGKDKKPVWEPEPHTIWLAASHKDQKQDLIPFGWALIEIDPQSEIKSADQFKSQYKETVAWLEQIKAKYQARKAELIKKHQQRREAQKKAAEQAAKRRAEEEALERQRAEAEKRKQAELEQAKQNLSPMAYEFRQQSLEQDWPNDKAAFLKEGVIENWLDRLEQQKDEQVLAELTALINQHIKGLLANPDKTKGKKKKPVYSERQRKIAHRLNALLS